MTKPGFSAKIRKFSAKTQYFGLNPSIFGLNPNFSGKKLVFLAKIREFLVFVKILPIESSIVFRRPGEKSDEFEKVKNYRKCDVRLDTLIRWYRMISTIAKNRTHKDRFIETYFDPK